MLNSIIRFALHYRMLIVVVSLVVLVYGGFTATTLPIDVFPDLDRPRVVIMTEVPGEAAEEVETLVTVPLERAMLGATGVQSVRSTSGPSLSVVTVEFGWDAQIHQARQVVQERLGTVTGTLPPNVHPQMAPIGSILGQIMLIGIHRRTGPNGGVLATVGNTQNLAELVLDPKDGQATVYLWNPRDENNRRLPALADWKPLQADAKTLALSWEDQANGGLPLAPLDTKKGKAASFRGSDSQLRENGKPVPDVDRRLTVTVGGKAYKVVFGSKQTRMIDLRTSTDWVVRPRILKISGVAQVFIMGEGRKQYHVVVSPEKLEKFNIALEDVEAALRKNNLNASGGWAERHMEEHPIRFQGRLGPQPEKAIAELRLVPLKKTGDRTITLDQVADITLAPAIKRGDSSVNGSPGILLTIARQPHFDTRAVTDDVLTALKELEDILPADIDLNPDFFQMKRFIDRGVYNVGEALGIGAVLVLIVLFLFLLNFRTTFISLKAIPLSLALTALSFKWIGWFSGTPLSINVMTLGGIAVAMGELVDDAIVDVENIFRRLRAWRAAGGRAATGRTALEVVYDASIEVRGAIVFGTIMVILVFLPLFALSGLEGRLFTPLGIAYIVSILASLLVSLTVTPVLSYYLLPSARATHREKDSPLLRGLKWLASHMVRFSMQYPGVLLATSWVVVALCGLVMANLGNDLLPDFDEGTIQLTTQLPPGASLKASNTVAPQVEARLQKMMKDGLIVGFLRRTGRSELEEHADPVNESEYLIGVAPDCGKTREEVKVLIKRDIQKHVPGLVMEAEQPLKHLMNETLSGVKAIIAIRIYGDDLDTLYASAVKVQDALAGIDGLPPPVIEPQKEITEYHITPRPDKLAHYKIDREHLAKWVHTAMHGEIVSEILEGPRRFDLVVRLNDEARTDYKKLPKLRVDLPDGKGWVPLEELATINEYGRGANMINHDNGRRRIVIKCTPAGRDVGSVVADIQARVGEKVKLPQGYFIEYGGQFESQQQATRVITLLGAVAVVGMFVVLYMLFPSSRIVLQILNALTMAFIGGVVALVLTQQKVTVAALVGFISLGGIAARNGILLVSHYFHLMKQEGEGFTQQMILRGSLERLAPVLMTALTAGISLVPLVVGGHEPGREILYPVATVILGGLVTSTLCEFLLHPGLFWKFSGKAVAGSSWEEESAQ